MELEEIKKRIKLFIEENNLDFTGSGSDLNGPCVILAGYCLYINGDIEAWKDGYTFLEKDLGFSIEAINEFKRVYDFAYNADYYKFWEKEDAHTIYKFEKI